MTSDSTFRSHERPGWCPHPDCHFVLNTQESWKKREACGGILPEPVEHDGGFNIKRLCIEADGVFDLQVNRGDLCNLERLIKVLREIEL
ncbi:hypothetical protein LCGC14_0231420 [marine sediment metagenome]|uniref:Uncharacterized protein n=1 Tax=marine sediment metagenome TaxID=412755 RepID=A0A0F9UA11_9ZZZZ